MTPAGQQWVRDLMSRPDYPHGGSEADEHEFFICALEAEADRRAQEMWPGEIVSQKIRALLLLELQEELLG